MIGQISNKYKIHSKKQSRYIKIKWTLFEWAKTFKTRFPKNTTFAIISLNFEIIQKKFLCSGYDWPAYMRQ